MNAIEYRQRHTQRFWLWFLLFRLCLCHSVCCGLAVYCIVLLRTPIIFWRWICVCRFCIADFTEPTKTHRPTQRRQRVIWVDSIGNDKSVCSVTTTEWNVELAEGNSNLLTLSKWPLLSVALSPNVCLCAWRQWKNETKKMKNSILMDSKPFQASSSSSSSIQFHRLSFCAIEFSTLNRLKTCIQLLFDIANTSFLQQIRLNPLIIISLYYLYSPSSWSIGICYTRSINVIESMSSSKWMFVGSAKYTRETRHQRLEVSYQSSAGKWFFLPELCVVLCGGCTMPS